MKKPNISGYDIFVVLVFAWYVFASYQDMNAFALQRIGLVLLAIALGRGLRWFIQRAKKGAPPNQARFLVVEKRSLQPLEQARGDVPSFTSPPFWVADNSGQVLLRFDPRGTDDQEAGDLLLRCSPELYARLREGMRGTGIWKENRLLEFTVEEATK